MIRAHDVSKSYNGRHILDAVSFSLDAGEILCLLGPSGCGKTTLLRLLAGFEAPDSGVIQRGEARIGFLFQDHELFTWRTVGRNIALGMELMNRDKNTIRSQTRSYLEKTGLSESANKLPREISGGMKRRAALAQVLATEPGLILLDEPLTGLDVIGRKRISDLIREYVRSRQAAALIVTHSIEETLFMADRAVIFTRPPARIGRELALSDIQGKAAFEHIYSSFMHVNFSENSNERCAS